MAKREWTLSKTLLSDVAFQLGVFLLFVPAFFFLAKQDLLGNETKYGSLSIKYRERSLMPCEIYEADTSRSIYHRGCCRRLIGAYPARCSKCH